MKKYIDKAAVVAEIERYKHKADERLKIKGRTLAEDCKDSALQNLCGNLLHFIDTLEVREAEEEPISNDIEAEFVLYLKHKFNIPQEGNKLKTNGWRPSPYDILDIAKHFAQWQKEQMLKEDKS